MSSAYGTITRAGPTEPLPLPLCCTLKDGNTSSIQSLDKSDNSAVHTIRRILNAAIESGDSYPQEEPMSEESFANYFLASDAFILRRDLDNAVLGAFYIKPNYPGRSSHVCNAGFLVDTQWRGLGVGRAMAKAFLVLAPKLGYRASMFNLVYETNTASISLWRSLGFQEVGRVPKGGRLKQKDGNGEEFVDAIMFHYEFSTQT